MKIIPDQRLFWFLKESVSLDLDEPASLDLYVQQVLSRGRAEDVKRVLKEIEPSRLRESFQRVKRFLPTDVRSFWEDFLRDYHSGSGSHP